MSLGKKILITLAITLSLSSCSSQDGEVVDYHEAKKIYSNGMTGVEIQEKFGNPVDIMNHGDLETWYYEPVDVLKVVRPGGEWTAFSIDLEDGRSARITPIIITRR